jgi:hypothetical protein
MRPLRWFIVDPRIGGQLPNALRTGPSLSRRHQRPSDRATPMLGFHVPPLDEAHRMARVTAVGVRAEADLDERDDAAVDFDNEENERRRARGSARQNRIRVLRVFGRGLIGPEGTEEACHDLEIGEDCTSDHGIHRVLPSLAAGRQTDRTRIPLESVRVIALPDDLADRRAPERIVADLLRHAVDVEFTEALSFELRGTGVTAV